MEYYGNAKVDELGRARILTEFIKKFQLESLDGLEIGYDILNMQITIKRVVPKCLFCGDGKDTIMFQDKYVCRDCIRNLENFLTMAN